MPNFKSKTIRGQGLVEYGLIVTQGATASILALAAPGIGLESIYCSAIEGLGGEGCGFIPEYWNIVRGDWTINDQLCGGIGEGRVFAEGYTGDDYVINIDCAKLNQGNGYGIYFRSTQPNLVDGNFKILGVPCGNRSVAILHHNSGWEYPITVNPGQVTHIGEIKFIPTTEPADQ